MSTENNEGKVTATETPREITVDDALNKLRETLKPEPKTYEQGLAEGLEKGKKEATEAAKSALAATVNQVERFSQAHGDTPAGRALKQIHSDTKTRLEKLVGGG